MGMDITSRPAGWAETVAYYRQHPEQISQLPPALQAPLVKELYPTVFDDTAVQNTRFATNDSGRITSPTTPEEAANYAAAARLQNTAQFAGGVVMPPALDRMYASQAALAGQYFPDIPGGYWDNGSQVSNVGVDPGSINVGDPIGANPALEGLGGAGAGGPFSTGLSPTQQEMLKNIEDPKARRQMELQFKMQNQAEVANLISNIFKLLHDIYMAIARNTTA